MKKQQQDLENNISSLFNTARAECERKDRRIDELQKKFDDIVFKRDTYRYRAMSDSSRHSSHSSRSTSPKDRKDRKDHRERKDLPSRSSNHHDRGNNNKHSKNYVNTDNRDTRDKYKGDKDKNNPKPVKRNRNDDRKSPPIKKPRYEPEKQKSEKTVKENERDNLRTKKNDSHEKNDKSKQKSKDKELNKDKSVKKKTEKVEKAEESTNIQPGKTIETLKQPKLSEVITSISISEEDGEIIDENEIKEHSVSQKNSNEANLSININKDIKKFDLTTNTLKGKTKNVSNENTVPTNQTIIPKSTSEDSAKSGNHEDAKESKISLIQPDKLISESEVSLKPKLNFSGMLDNERKKKEVISSIPLTASVMFSQSPSPTATNSAFTPDSIDLTSTSSNSNVTASNFDLNNSRIVNSTPLVRNFQEKQLINAINAISANSISVASSENSSDNINTNCNDSTIVNTIAGSTIDKENIHDRTKIVERDSKAEVTSPSVGTGRGKPRPKRRGGTVKMID